MIQVDAIFPKITPVPPEIAHFFSISALILVFAQYMTGSACAFSKTKNKN